MQTKIILKSGDILNLKLSKDGKVLIDNSRLKKQESKSGLSNVQAYLRYENKLKLLEYPKNSQWVKCSIRDAEDRVVIESVNVYNETIEKVRKNRTEFGKKYYDMSKNVVGIIKIRVDRVHDWIGSGELLTQNSLFPPAAYDYGYDILLTRTDLFDETFKIARYV